MKIEVITVDQARSMYDLLAKKEKNRSGIIDKVRKNIIFQLINTKQYEKLLADVPHRSFLDLSIVYRYIPDVGHVKDNSIDGIIHNDFARTFGLTEPQLYALAKQNTERIRPFRFELLKERIKRIPECEEYVQEMDANSDLWFLSNEQETHGAVTMLYKDLLDYIAAEVDSDLYILPSSIHELLAVSVDTVEHDIPWLANMVYQVNMNDVEPEDRLSNSIYYYSRETGEITFAYKSDVEIRNDFYDFLRKLIGY